MLYNSSAANLACNGGTDADIDDDTAGHLDHIECQNA